MARGGVVGAPPLELGGDTWLEPPEGIEAAPAITPLLAPADDDSSLPLITEPEHATAPSTSATPITKYRPFRIRCDPSLSKR